MALTTVNAQMLSGAMTADSSGNVGIGTTTPTAKLHTQIGAGATAGLKALNVNGGGLQFYTDTTGANADVFIESPKTGVAMAFLNGGSERMRIDSSGALLVNGTTNIPSAKFVVYGNSNSNWTSATYVTPSTGQLFGHLVSFNNQSPNSTDSYFFYGGDNSAARFFVKANGGISNYSANNTNLSDQREKKDIELAGKYLDKICQIPVKTFLYVDQPAIDTEKTLGVIAQDVQAVAPELVTESNWANVGEEPKMRLSIYQTDLQYALMKAIQELKAEVDQLKTQLAAK